MESSGQLYWIDPSVACVLRHFCPQKGVGSLARCQLLIDSNLPDVLVRCTGLLKSDELVSYVHSCHVYACTYVRTHICFIHQALSLEVAPLAVADCFRPFPLFKEPQCIRPKRQQDCQQSKADT